MDDRARRADCGWHLAAPKAVQRFNPKMLAQGEPGVIGQEREIVVGKRPRDLAELAHLSLAYQQFGRRDARQIVEERAAGSRLRQSKFARAQFRVGKTEAALMEINRAEIIGPVGF